MKDYTISANDPDAVSISIHGNDMEGNQMEMIYRVDQTGRSGGQVNLTGIERCVTDRDATQWKDSYMRTEDWLPKDLEDHRKLLQDTAKQRPIAVTEIAEFGENLMIDGQKIFEDDVKDNRRPAA